MTNILSTPKTTSRTSYIYKVTNLENGQYYIGSQCSGKTIGVNYFTSSTNKAFKDGFKTYGEEKYKIVIIKEFEDPEECVHVENYIIRNYMQKKDGLCVNRFYCCGNEKIFSAVGLHHTEEARKKISITRKGTHHTEKTKQKISIALKGHPSRKKGIPLAGETRQKISMAHKERIKISIEGTVFNSIRAASKYYNVSIPTIRYWAKKNKHNAFYIEK